MRMARTLPDMPIEIWSPTLVRLMLALGTEADLAH